jgi:hypothetical protein
MPSFMHQSDGTLSFTTTNEAYMHITVSLHGVFRIDRFKQKTCDYPKGSDVQTIIEDLEISTTLLGIILINGIHAQPKDILAEGDILMLLPLLDGG